MAFDKYGYIKYINYQMPLKIQIELKSRSIESEK